MNQFLENHKLPKLAQGELAASIKGIEVTVKNLLKNRISGLHGFTGEFYQTVQEKLAPILHSLFQKTEDDASQLIL